MKRFYKLIFIASIIGSFIMASNLPKNESLPESKNYASPYDVPQADRVLPREMGVPGTATGRSNYNVGGENGVYIDGNKGIYAGNKDNTLAPFWVDLNGNVIGNAATFQNVTIKDSGGISVIDSSGLVSTTQFNYGSLNATLSTQNTATTDFSYQISGLTLTFTVSRNVVIYAFANVMGGSAGAGTTSNKALFRMSVDGTLFGNESRVAGHYWWTSADARTANFLYDEEAALNGITTISAGTHTLDVRMATTAGGGLNNAYVGPYSSSIGYIILGK